MTEPHPLDIPEFLKLSPPPAQRVAAWKQDNLELVEAQKHLAKIKRRKKRNGKPSA
jgi:hypothetical protein